MTLPDAGCTFFNYDSTLLGIFIDISIIILPLVMLLLLLLYT